MNIDERMSVLNELKTPDIVIEFRDKDDSACDAIDMALQIYDEVVFANGGDRVKMNIPEYERYKDDPRVIFEFGVGGDDKMNSSSKLLEEWVK